MEVRDCVWQAAFININERLKGKMFYLFIVDSGSADAADKIQELSIVCVN